MQDAENIKHVGQKEERLTQMSVSCQAGVKAHLQHLFSPPHEEVNDSVGDYAVREPLDDVVVALSDVQAVALLPSFFH